MKKYFIYLILIITLILQTTLGKYISIFNIAPNFILVVVICYCFKNNVVKSALVGIAAGFLVDVASGRTIGLNAILMLYTCIAVSSMGGKFSRDTLFVAVTTCFISTVIFEFIYALFNFLIFGKASFFYILLRIILLEAVYNGIIIIPIYLFMRKIYSKENRYY